MNFVDCEAFLENGTIMSLENGQLLIGFGARQWVASPENPSPAFYFPDFFLKNPFPWFHHEFYQEQTFDAIIKGLKKEQSFCSAKHQWVNLDQPHFISGFEQLQGLFQAKKLEKAVPFAFEFAPCRMSRETLRKSLLHLLEYARNQPTYVYGFWDQHSGILGATPEVLFKVDSKEKNILHTHACAGTRSSQNKISLLEDPKELHEHRLVVQGMSESLASFGKLHIGDLKVLQLPFLSHLITPIEVELHATYDFEKIVKALHPTPALGGFPKQASWDWLHAYQISFDRGRFGAPAGYLYDQAHTAACFVSIRNMQWDEEKMLIGAGCGIVAESRLADEWEEINLKMQSIKRMLDL